MFWEPYLTGKEKEKKKLKSQMKPLDLALKYMEIFYSNDNIEALGEILSEDLVFEGPFYKFTSAEDYMDSLRKAPPKGMKYEIIKTYENDSGACLVYQFSKKNISLPMAQIFEVEKEKILKIILIFDTSPFL